MKNYPFPKKNNSSSSINKSRGMLFENELNKSNEFYLNINAAIIYKKPTPIRIVKVEYPSRSHAKITEAYYQTPSTTDYNGIYKGKYIDFEAKETKSLSFSYTHIFKHQIDHLINVKKHGGIAFVIIYFKKVNKIYIIDIDSFIKPYNLGKKSISIKDIDTLDAVEVKMGYAPLIDYLKAVDKLYFLNY